MWSGPCQQLALATVLDAPHGPRPTHEHVRKTSPVTCCASAVTGHLSHLCTVGIAHRVRARTAVPRGAGGRHRTLDSGDLSAAVWVSIAVCSSQYPSSCREYADRRVRVRGGRGGAPKSRGAARNEDDPGRAKYVFFTHLSHTEVRTGNFRQPRTVSLLSSVPSRLQSPKSSERAQSPISRRAPSTGARVPVGRLGRPVPVF